MRPKAKPATGTRSSLAMATLGLLGAAAPPTTHGASKGWEFDSAVLVYSESDGRVLAIEPVVQATRNLDDERVLTAKVVFDSLSGASPNGATPASTPQTFSRPSGIGSYTTQPGDLPLDSTFKDSRIAVSGDYTLPVGEDSKLGLGLNGSTEYDYLSIGANLRYALDLNQDNTTLSAGLSYQADTIKPVGRAPEPLAPTEPYDRTGSAPTESKNVIDVVLGLTQVLGPRSLVQLSYSLSSSSGYHTDPYKILSVVGADGEPLRYVYESRPDTRTKHAVFARFKRLVFARDVIDLSWRYLADDWNVRSHTAEATYRWNLDASNFIEPHLRWYSQAAAEFYRAALYDGEETTVDYASADPRLGAFDGLTVGLKYGHTFDNGSQWSARLESYEQRGSREGVPQQASAGLSKFDLEPDLSAVMLTLGYRFGW